MQDDDRIAAVVRGRNDRRAAVHGLAAAHLGVRAGTADDRGQIVLAGQSAARDLDQLRAVGRCRCDLERKTRTDIAMRGIHDAGRPLFEIFAGQKAATHLHGGGEAVADFAFEDRFAFFCKGLKQQSQPGQSPQFADLRNPAAGRVWIVRTVLGKERRAFDDVAPRHAGPRNADIRCLDGGGHEIREVEPCEIMQRRISVGRSRHADGPCSGLLDNRALGQRACAGADADQSSEGRALAPEERDEISREPAFHRQDGVLHETGRERRVERIPAAREGGGPGGRRCGVSGRHDFRPGNDDVFLQSRESGHGVTASCR